MTTDQFAALRRGFTVEDKRPEREYFIVTCKTCKARWSLKTAVGGVNGANVLHLLNHEAGCTGVVPA